MTNDNLIDPIDAHVGERLRLKRMLLRLSQSYLGSCVGVTFQQIQKYETGANRISASKLAYLSYNLGVTVEYFFQGLPTELTGNYSIVSESSKELTNLMADREAMKFLGAFHAIKNPKHRKAILGMVMAMGKDQSNETCEQAAE